MNTPFIVYTIVVVLVTFALFACIYLTERDE